MRACMSDSCQITPTNGGPHRRRRCSLTAVHPAQTTCNPRRRGRDRTVTPEVAGSSPVAPVPFQAVSGTSKARASARAFVLVREKARPAPVAAAIARSFIRCFEGDAEGAEDRDAHAGACGRTRLPDLPDAASHEARASTPDWRHNRSGTATMTRGSRPSVRATERLIEGSTPEENDGALAPDARDLP